MLAIMHGQFNQWLPASKRLLAQAKAVPFAFDVQVCCCHGYTWQRMADGGMLLIVRWSD